jgi:hypothetical protein
MLISPKIHDLYADGGSFLVIIHRVEHVNCPVGCLRIKSSEAERNLLTVIYTGFALHTLKLQLKR